MATKKRQTKKPVGKLALIEELESGIHDALQNSLLRIHQIAYGLHSDFVMRGDKYRESHISAHKQLRSEIDYAMELVGLTREDLVKAGLLWWQEEE